MNMENRQDGYKTVEYEISNTNLSRRMNIEGVRGGYKTVEYEYEISNWFPVKPPYKYQCLFDCRLQLLLHQEYVIKSGSIQTVATTCLIHPNHGYTLMVKNNPQLGLIVHEEYIHQYHETFRLFITVSNTSGENKHLACGECIAYLILHCGM